MNKKTLGLWWCNMAKYILKSSTSLEEDGYEEKRTYEFDTDGTLDDLAFKIYNWLHVEGYVYVDTLEIHKSDGGVHSSAGW